MSAACPEFGFDLAVRLAPGLPAGERDALRRAFLRAVEAHGLAAAGGGDAVWRYTITRDGGQAVDADRDALRAWAGGRPGVVDVSAGPLVDVRLAAG
jgi:uncharacterized protein YggL (DUF469 family)